MIYGWKMANLRPSGALKAVNGPVRGKGQRGDIFPLDAVPFHAIYAFQLQQEGSSN